MGNHKIRQSIQSLYQRIQEHQFKITREEAQPQPDIGLIRHWQSEIRAFTIQMQRYEDRLAQRRRRGR